MMTESLASSFSSIRLSSDSCDDYLVIAAIDFGTSNSGYAFAFQDKGSRDIKSSAVFLNKWQIGSASSFTDKAPTTVLLNPDKTFDSFGYAAEDKYAKLCETNKQRGWWYFEKFKMVLYQSKNLSRDVQINDAEDKPMAALDVFSIVIGHLKDNIVHDVRAQNSGIRDEDILYVLTVPAIWSDAAKQLMREAATSRRVGIENEQLKLVLEPEAASVYCRQTLSDTNRNPDGSVTLVSLPVGHKYIIADLGGGTLDLATHEVIADGKLHEVHVARGDDLGGQVFNKKFLEFFGELVGEETFKTWRMTEPSDYLMLLRSIEGFKWEITKSSEDIVLKLDISLLETLKETSHKTLENAVDTSRFKDSVKVVGRGKLSLTNTFLRAFFDDILVGIHDHIASITRELPNIGTIFVVGGLAKAPYIRTFIQDKFPGYRLLVPEDPGVGVLKGAVLLGKQPQTIAGRIANCSYGFGVSGKYIPGKHKEEYMFMYHDYQYMYCKHLFVKIIEKGQVLKYGDVFEELRFSRPRDQQQREQEYSYILYQSTQKDPVHTTDDGCAMLGEIVAKPPESGWPAKYKLSVKIVVGEAEFKFFVTTADHTQQINVDFLLQK